MEVREREIKYLSLHCHTRMTPAMRWTADESCFNVSLTVSDKVTRQCIHHNYFQAKGKPNRGPSAYQPNVLPLGQTGSHGNSHIIIIVIIIIIIIERISRAPICLTMWEHRALYNNISNTHTHTHTHAHTRA